ncbi:hypothetical protein NQ314_010719 [Rhamnusium bicolor]|uniref:Uncharacterized protein n=1 Tax=Rhamnusium bicolor TaxID=1586634 RepID=A0AAV8XPG9_9CUCU|nr:hypothetical protein NQ314_010719 [Rhamnusium bicolor]
MEIIPSTSGINCGHLLNTTIQSEVYEPSLSSSSISNEPFEGGSSDEYQPSKEDDSDSEQEQNNKINTSPPKKKSRWRKSNPITWEKNIIKKKRSLGEPYESGGKKRPAKMPKEIDCTSCKYKCNQKFDLEYRKLLSANYWKFDYCRQKDFILSCVKGTAPKCRKPRTNSREPKGMSRYYFFKKDEEEIRVCKSFFLKTLCISHGPVDRAFKGRNEHGSFKSPDRRGRKEPANKTPGVDIQEVKNHIESFPVMESHYCRETNQRQYLDPTLSITKMYNLYVQECENNNKNKVSEAIYRKIFCTDYNLAFFKPKKDQCSTCEKYKNKLISEVEYKEHLRRRDEEGSMKTITSYKFIKKSYK